MAKETLPIDFKDDILDQSMNGKRRYNLIQNEDGTVSFEDVTDYSQIGSDFGQKQINQTNQAVNESADKNRIIDDLDDISANTQAGMMAGALAVRELNGKTNLNIQEIHVDTGFLKSGVHFYKRNSNAMIHFSSLMGWSLPYGSTKLCSVPAGYEPVKNKKFTLYYGAVQKGFVEIKPDGLYATVTEALDSTTIYLHCDGSYWI